MDELLTQFLVESRELVEQATDDLLGLEESPHDRERFEGVFRAFHTLKGGAAIIEFAAMQEALHRAEDMLGAARSNAEPLSAADVGDCLFCLDRIVEWLDTLESTGIVPVDVDAGEIVGRFARSPDNTMRPTADENPAHAGDWTAPLLLDHRAAAVHARSAIRYRPETDSFYRHQDPLAHIAALPGLLAVGIEPRVPWPPPHELDPFACNLIITALSGSPPGVVAAALGEVAEQCDVEALPQGAAAAAERHSAFALAREILAAQQRLLDDTNENPQAARIASAGLVAANVLRSLGRVSEAEQIAAIARDSATLGNAEGLRRALAAADDGRAPADGDETTAHERRGTREQTLRVSALRVDELVKLTGELTIVKNAIGHAVKVAEEQGSALTGTLKHRHATLDRLTGELQRSVLALRVLPLRNVFQRFPRLVRELAADLHKPTTLLLEGEDTEADKAIVELLVEPLLHIVRNAMDHGIESAAARAAAGKPRIATIRMRAFREHEHVVIEVTDDGRGIDVDKIREVAQRRKVAQPAALAALSDPEAIDLIFTSGFSTAEEVTELSGRGVGLDAVRTAVKRLGGQVSVASTSPNGTTIRVTLPFSIMMAQVMTVEASGQLFGIPLESVVETLRVPRGDVLPVGAAHAIVLRDRTVPVVQLGRILGAATSVGTAEALVVIADVNGEIGALEVDRVGERMDVMLKPLDGILAGLPGIAGSTLLGDGSVLLVLDLPELLQ
jgi:two-component system chemotaxis sensor kinase CheA